jgi:hypothetical protein
MQSNYDPYVGPRPFEENDRKVFFGRDHETNELASLITAHPIVLLYAQSGAGKTSLVKASLIPMLVNEERFDVLPPMRVREQAGVSVDAKKIENIYMFNAIASAAHSQPDQMASEPDWHQLARTSFSQFLNFRKKLSGEAALYTPTVAVFDQFEELFTLYPERWEERQRFFEQIRDALAEDSLLRVLFSIREDFIAELDPYAYLLPEKLRTRFRIERLNRRSALVAVTQPLKAISATNGERRFAEGAAEELIDNLLTMEVKTRDGIKRVPSKFVEALQLQVVCQSLWNSLKPGEHLITRKHLETFGDLNTALSAFYENAIEKTTQRTGVRSGALRRWCERNLITSAGTRAPVFRDENETSGLKNEAVDELERQSLLRMELRGGARWYELSHDRFVEVIKQSNQKWLFALPGTKQNLLRLEERAVKWDETNREAKDLLNETDLFEAERWLASPDASELELGPELLAFLRESRTAIDAKAQLEGEKRQRVELQAKTADRFRRLSYVLGVLVLLAIVASGVAGWQWWKAYNLKLKAEQQTVAILEARQKEEALGRKVNTLQQNQEVLTRSAKVAEAVNKLNNGDLQGAASEFHAILNEGGHDPIDMAIAHWGLGRVEFKSPSPKYSKAIQNYDNALKVLGYDAQGKQLPNFQIPADSESKFQEKAAFCLREKGELYFEWGNGKRDPDPLSPNNSKASDMYRNALAFYRKAKSLGGPGAGLADAGISKAQKAIDDVEAARARANEQSTPEQE